METILEIYPLSKNAYKFNLKFINNKDKQEELAIDKLKNSAEMVGFHFEESGKRLEPVDFKIISKEVYHSSIVQPKERISIDFVGQIEKKGKYFCLIFKNATYLVLPGKIYKVWFSLDGYKSKSVDIKFDCNFNDLE